MANFQATNSDMSDDTSQHEHRTSVGQEVTDLPALAYIDILPKLVHPGNASKKMAPKFQTFHDIINGANLWLREHQNFYAWKCETVERKVNTGCSDGQICVDLDSMCYQDVGVAFNCFVFGLRLWLVKNAEKTVQELGLINIVPREKTGNSKEGQGHSAAHGGSGRTTVSSNVMVPCLEGLTQMLERFNDQIKEHPIPGLLLNVESTQVKFAESNQKMALDDVAMVGSWDKAGGITSKSFVQILRLFYVKGSPTSLKIKMTDFLPDQEGRPDDFSKMKFSCFDDVLEQVSLWIQQKTDTQIINIETRDAKIVNPLGKAKVDVDTDCHEFSQFAKVDEERLRFIRVFSVDSPTSTCPPLTSLTSRLFLPVSLGANKFETMRETMNRIDAWLKVTRAPIMSVETVRYLKEYIKEASLARPNFNLTAFGSKTWVSAIRIYFRSAFEEPEPSLLPHLPLVSKSKRQKSSKKRKKCTIL